MNTDLSDIFRKGLTQQPGNEIGPETIFVLTLIGVVLLLLFYILRKFVIPALPSRKAVKKGTTNIYRLEVLLWVLFAGFSVYRLISDNFTLGASLVVVVALAGFNFWRDLLAGIIIKLENNVQIGDPVRFKEYAGVISSMDRRSIQLKTDNDEIVFIAYRHLDKDIIVKRQAKGKLISSKIKFNLSGHNQEEMVKRLEVWVYECPWTITGDEIPVQMIDGENVAITIYAVDAESLAKAELFIKSNLSKL